MFWAEGNLVSVQWSSNPSDGVPIPTRLLTTLNLEAKLGWFGGARN